jgi:hypothetical protein
MHVLLTGPPWRKCPSCHELSGGTASSRPCWLCLTLCRTPAFPFNILAEFPHQPCKGPLTKEKVRGLLVFPDLTKRHNARPIAVRCVRPSSRFFCGLACRFCCKLLPWGLPPCAPPRSLLCARHGVFPCVSCYGMDFGASCKRPLQSMAVTS